MWETKQEHLDAEGFQASAGEHLQVSQAGDGCRAFLRLQPAAAGMTRPRGTELPLLSLCATS
jgi:hypothetical protein